MQPLIRRRSFKTLLSWDTGVQAEMLTSACPGARWLWWRRPSSAASREVDDRAVWRRVTIRWKAAEHHRP